MGISSRSRRAAGWSAGNLTLVRNPRMRLARLPDATDNLRNTGPIPARRAKSSACNPVLFALTGRRRLGAIRDPIVHRDSLSLCDLRRWRLSVHRDSAHRSEPQSKAHRRLQMPSNRGVVYLKPGKVEVQRIDFPTFRNPAGKTIDHGVILKVVTTNICGSAQHMVRGRTTAPAGMVLGHEITGEVIETGRDVEDLEIGDLVSVPFNVACGRCRTCRDGDTGVCLHVNSDRAGGAYGYVDMGGWIGGQAHYVMVPYAEFNPLKFPDNEQAMEKNPELTLPSDILATR